MKVQILGNELLKQGEKYNSYRISYAKDGVEYKAIQFGKEPLPTGELDCEITEQENTATGDKFAKIKKVQTGGGGRGYTPKTEEQLRLEEKVKYPSFAVSYAKDCFVGGKIDRKDIDALSNEMYNMMVILGSGKSSQPMAKETTQQEDPELEEGDLPF